MTASAVLTLLLLILATHELRPSSVTVMDAFDDVIHLPFPQSAFFVDHKEALAGKNARLKFGSKELWSGVLNKTGFVQVPNVLSEKKSKPKLSPFHLGKYVLSIDDNPDIQFIVPKILCSDSGNLCQQRSPNCSNARHFCTISYSKSSSKNTVNFCDLPSDKDICAPSSYDVQQICTQEFTESYSICRIYQFENLVPLALVQDLEGDEDTVSTRDCTYRDSNVVAFVLDNVFLEMGSYILKPNSSASLVVKCAHKSTLTLNICFLVHDAKLGAASSNAKIPCVNTTCDASLKKILSAGQSADGQVVTMKARHGEFLSHIHLVDFPTSIGMQKADTCRQVKCRLDIKQVDPRFRIQWQVYRNDLLFINEKNYRSYHEMNFSVAESGGSYHCLAKIRFRVCSPFTEFFKTCESKRTNFTVNDFPGQTDCNLTTTSDFISSSEDFGVPIDDDAAASADDYDYAATGLDSGAASASGSSTAGIRIVVAIVFLILCVISVVVAIFVYIRRRNVETQTSATASISVKSKLMAAAAAAKEKKATTTPVKQKIADKSAASTVKSTRSSKSPATNVKKSAKSTATASLKKGSQKNHLTLPLLSLLETSNSVRDSKSANKTKKISIHSRENKESKAESANSIGSNIL